MLAPSRIPLNVPTFGQEETDEAMETLRSGMVTMGRKVRAFEEAWAKYCGRKYGIMTNSGSSANLVALTALRCLGKLQEGDEVITPALTWATTVFPIAQAGCVPVLADVDLETYNLSLSAATKALTKKTGAVMPVHLLGNPIVSTDAPRIVSHRDTRSPGLVLWDCCEAHGAQVRGRNVGSFGLAATFSFFFSHHISTVEGGMVVTDDLEFADTCRSLRAFGWVRDMSDREAFAKQHPDIDARFLFRYPGFNVRPMEVQGAFGLHQLPKLEGLIEHRRQVAFYWNSELETFSDYLQLPKEQPGTRHVFFAYPFLLKPGCPFTRNEFREYLEARGVETRQIEAGNMAIQPAMKYIRHRIAGPLTNAQYIHDNGFFIGCHQGVGEAEREAVVQYCREFFERHHVGSSRSVQAQSYSSYKVRGTPEDSHVV